MSNIGKNVLCNHTRFRNTLGTSQCRDRSALIVSYDSDTLLELYGDQDRNVLHNEIGVRNTQVLIRYTVVTMLDIAAVCIVISGSDTLWELITGRDRSALYG